jgi:transmembrane sensor
MNDKERLKIIQRISSGIASDDELGQYNAWCNSLQEPGLPVADFGVLRTRMLTNINHKIDNIRFIRLRYYKIASVAAALVAVVFGLWFYNFRMLSYRKVDIVYQNDVAPGKNRAALTFANGKTIQLSDAQQGVKVGKDLKYYDGTEIDAERTQPQLLTATTPRGGAYEITLPDGTRVWLNADSKLSFPSSFSGGERRVSLKGEAYFEVAKSYLSKVKGDKPVKERIPFVVVTDQQEVTVLGTHFNVNSYEDETATKTTLLEGSVRVAVSGTKNALLFSSCILKPGEQAINDGGIRTNKVDVEEVVAWKNGSTVFQDKTLESIMRELSRWYDITVVYSADAPRHEFFSGAVSRTRNISSVLERMQTTGSVKFRIEGRTVIVSK